MFRSVILGTNNLKKACAFYDELLELFGAHRLGEHPRGMIWGGAADQPKLAVLSPYDGEPATAGNGTMLTLEARSTEHVDALHQKAMELGAKNEGNPGKRSDTWYGAYFRNLDGNKLAVCCIVEG